jgi:hypothetical protein
MTLQTFQQAMILKRILKREEYVKKNVISKLIVKYFK